MAVAFRRRRSKDLPMKRACPRFVMVSWGIWIAGACGAPAPAPESPGGGEQGPEVSVEEDASNDESVSPDDGEAAGDGESPVVPVDEEDWLALADELAVKAGENPEVLVGGAKVTEVLHCGGAAPPIDSSYSVTRPFTGQVLVREGDENSTSEPVAVLQPDVRGVFEMELPAGTYCLVESSRKDPPDMDQGQYVDTDCLISEWKKCDAVVEHPSGAPVWVSLFDPCFGPCYFGPMPP